MALAHREALTAIHAAAIAAVEGRAAVRHSLAEAPLDHEPWHVVALGKAAMAMAHGAADALGDQIVRALAITRVGYADSTLTERMPVQILTAPHPVPDARSLAAGEALVRFLDEAGDEARFLFLISGGSSSLVERLAGDADADALAELNQSLLAGGLDIGRMNRIRKAVSTIKGGRLANWLRGRRAEVLLISDVPGDDPAVIGSGLLAGDAAPIGQAEAASLLPQGLQLAEPPPSPDDSRLATVFSRIVASNQLAMRAAAKAAREMGYAVRCSDAFLQGEATLLGAELAEAVLAGPSGMTIWGGEPTVTLPERPGRGGRMQALALSAAQKLANTDALMLAAGTDGADGPGEDAGALVDGGTLERGANGGLDARECLVAADAGRFLAASGDLIQTGATGTNVMDLVIGLRP